MNAPLAESSSPRSEPSARDARFSQPSLHSLIRYSPAMIALLIALADVTRIADPDVWWHIRSGQLMLAEGRMITHDPYSYSAPGHLWLNHEWLSDVMLAFSYDWLGVFGLKLFKLLCTGATILLLAGATAETGASTLAQLAVMLAAAIAIEPQIQFRPQVLSYAMLSAVILLIARDCYRRAGGLWLAVPILALWANLHGAFIMGLAALGIYAAVTGAQDLAAGRGLVRGLRLSMITVAAFAATLLNPYGIGLWDFIRHALTNPYTRGTLSDWKPLYQVIAAQWHLSPAGAIYYACSMAIVVALAIAIAIEPAPNDLPLIAIAAVMAAAAFLSARNVPLAVITAAVPLAYHVSLRTARKRIDAAASTPEVARATPINQAIIAILAVSVLAITQFFSARMPADEPYPAGAVAFMKSHGIAGNLLCFYDWGGYVIFHDAPPMRMFIDPRFDTVYPREIVHDYLVFHFNLPGASRVLAKYPHDLVLISPTLSATKLMDSSPGWKLVYRDKDSLLYARADSAVAKIGGIPITGTAVPSTFP